MTTSIKKPEGAEGGLPAKLSSKEQPKKLPNSASPEESSQIQQLVTTLSQALKQSMAMSTETESKRNVRAPRVYSASQNFKTWLSQFLQFSNLVQIKPSERSGYLLTPLEQSAYKGRIQNMDPFMAPVHGLPLWTTPHFAKLK